MKYSFILVLSVLAALLVAPRVLAQSPPGWGWVNRLGTYVSNGGRGENGMAGLGRDAAGNLYLAGTYVGTPAFGSTVATNLGETDVFLAKYDPAGNLLWLRTLQSSGFDAASALVAEPSGRCTLTGTFGGGLTGGNLSFGSFGTPFSLAGPALLGSDKSPFGYGSVPFIASIDAAGALQWADRPTPTYGLGVVGLHRDNSGNCYISATMAPQSTLTVNGQTYPSVGSVDAVLIKYTVAGQPVWVRRVGAPGVYTNCADVYTDNADAVYWLVGHTGTISIDQVTVGVNSSVGANSLVKLSAGNRVRWIKNNLLRIGADNVVSEFLDLDAGNNALYFSCGSVGGAISYTGSGSPLAVPANTYTECVARCDTAGQIQWVKPVLFATDIATLQGAGIQGFRAGGNGFTFVTKTVSFGTTFFNGLSRTFGAAEGGLVCVLHFNTATNQCEWVRVGGVAATRQQPGPGNTIGAAAIDAVDNVYVTGTFSGTAQFGAITIGPASIIQPEIFLAKLDQALVTAVKPAAAGQGQPWSVYPNPATGTVQLVGLPAPALVRVYDAQGRRGRELPAVSTATVPRTLSGLAPGLYLLQVANTKEPYQSQRLVMQ